ncbi:MAG: TraY domain-containing protein [Acidobacteriota bacterium]
MAKRTGRSKTLYVTQAIEEHLQEPEDIYIAEQRLIELCAGRRRTSTKQEVKRELGLAD